MPAEKRCLRELPPIWPPNMAPNANSFCLGPSQTPKNFECDPDDRPALNDTGDMQVTEQTIQQILADGIGARRQKAVMLNSGNLRKVLLDAAQRTTANPQQMTQ